MNFANPLMLWGLAGALAPVAIHLAGRGRPRRVEWAAMRFVRAAAIRRQRRSRWEDLVLLLLRCLLIALIAFGLAGPTASVRVVGAKTVVAVVDVSGSMGDGVEGTTSLDLAKGALEKRLDALGPGSRAALWAAGDGVRQVIPMPTRDFVQLKGLLPEVRGTGRGSDLSGAVAAAIKALQGEGGEREVWVITDGRGAALAGIAEVAKGNSDVRVEVVTARAEVSRNVGVVEAVPGGIALAGQPVRILATVKNFGTAAERNVRVTLTADTDRAAMDEATVESLAAGEATTVSLTARFATEGDKGLAVRLAGDEVPVDDVRTLVLPVVRQMKVLVVEGSPEETGAKQNGFFLRQAMGGNVVVETAGEGELEGKALDDYATVVLAGVGHVSPAAAEKLHGQARRGHGLVVFVGGKTDASQVSTELSLPATVGNAGDANRLHLMGGGTGGQLDHAIARAWRSVDARTLGSVTVTRRMGLNPALGRGEVVLRYTDGEAAVVAGKMWADAPGRCVVVGTTANTAWSDLPLRPGVFVPLVHGAVMWAGAADAGEKKVTCGQAAVMAVPAGWGNKKVEVELPSGAKVLATTGEMSLTFAETDLPGMYRVRAEGGGDALMFAAVPNGGESEIAAATDAVPTEAEGAAQAGMAPRSYWGPVLGGALLVAVLELGLAQFFTRRRAA